MFLKATDEQVNARRHRYLGTFPDGLHFIEIEGSDAPGMEVISESSTQVQSYRKWWEEHPEDEPRWIEIESEDLTIG